MSQFSLVVAAAAGGGLAGRPASAVRIVQGTNNLLFLLFCYSYRDASFLFLNSAPIIGGGKGTGRGEPARDTTKVKVKALKYPPPGTVASRPPLSPFF